MNMNEASDEDTFQEEEEEQQQQQYWADEDDLNDDLNASQQQDMWAQSRAPPSNRAILQPSPLSPPPALAHAHAE